MRLTLFLKLLIIFIVVLGGVLFFWDAMQLPEIKKGITDLIQKTEKQISTLPPLRAEKEAPESFLTRAGIIQWTNIQREKYGLPPLRENAKLNASAVIKVEDMLANQYFSHQSPSGAAVGDLAESVGYEFIAIGENLALGNFENDEGLVQAWMDSPGHRANILNPQYQEIGVAVAEGLAAQHFGLPLSACSQPDETIKAEINTNQNQLEELQKTLELLQFEIKNARPKRGPAYTQKIEQYNNLISQYNTLVAETESLINQYNNQVRLFNECATGILG